MPRCIFVLATLLAPGMVQAQTPAASPAVIAPSALPGMTTQQTPAFIQTLSATPKAMEPMRRLYTTVLYGGTLSPQIKMAIGLKVAEETHVPYLAAHMRRLLQATPEAVALLQKPQGREAEAMVFASTLTRSIDGLSPVQWDAIRTQFNDAQIVELTLTNCYFNYLARLCAANNLQLEAWAKLPAVPLAAPAREAAQARITLASDAELEAAAKLKAPPAAASPSASLGTFIPNSRRAMVRVPDIADAWWDYWQAVREYNDTTRAEKLQVSFAVSTVNGCRYCTLHQVLGLRRAGVDVAKLVAMKKDDRALTPREKAAVDFARKLTRAPGQMTPTDLAALKAVLGDQGAQEIILQTCAFNFMNRFTDPLGLPSEDEAVSTYQEVYGPTAYRDFHNVKTR